MESLSCDSFFREALLICNVPEIRKNKKQNLRWVHSEHEIKGCDWQQYFFQEHPYLAATEGEERQKCYPFIEKCHGASLELGLKDQGGELGVGRRGRGHPFSLKFCVIFKELSEKWKYL